MAVHFKMSESARVPSVDQLPRHHSGRWQPNPTKTGSRVDRNRSNHKAKVSERLEREKETAKKRRAG